jgi:AcrR family transcriptional regulator
MCVKKLNKTARETQKNIKDALLRLLETKKLDEITVIEIHQEARCSRQTFYRHYKSVEEVCVDTIKEIFEDFFKEHIGGKKLSLNKFLHLFFDLMLSKKAIINLFLDAGCEMILIKLYFTIVLNIMDTVLPKKENVSSEKRCRENLIILGAIMSMAYYSFENGFVDSPEQLASYVESKLNI